MKKIIVFLIDYVLLFGSIILSFILLKNGVLLNYKYNIGAFYYLSPIIALAYLANCYVFGMFNLFRQSIGEIIYTVFVSTVGLTISIMAACFFVRESASSYPRSVILLSFFIYFAVLATWRILLQKTYLNVYGKRKALIIGSKSQAITAALQHKLKRFYIVKDICEEDDENILAKADGVNDIFITTDISVDYRERIFLITSKLKDIRVYFQPQIHDIGILNAKMHSFDDVPVHLFRKLYLNQEERVAKRFIDLFVSIVTLIIFSPLLCLIPILIKLDGGPVFYRQERLTRGGRKFRIIKFRTMVPDAEQLSGPMLSEQNDKRITRVGSLLRNTRLDEIPQLLNIIRGEMSLIGPRPERPFFAEQLEKDIPEFNLRLNVKAGLTGLAQVMGKYNTGFRQKLHYDLIYIYQFSLLRDFIILLQTVKIVFWKGKVEGFAEGQAEVNGKEKAGNY